MKYFIYLCIFLFFYGCYNKNNNLSKNRDFCDSIRKVLSEKYSIDSSSVEEYLKLKIIIMDINNTARKKISSIVSENKLSNEKIKMMIKAKSKSLKHFKSNYSKKERNNLYKCQEDVALYLEKIDNNIKDAFHKSNISRSEYYILERKLKY